MGWDIDGWIEARDEVAQTVYETESPWRGVMSIDHLTGARNPLAFAHLFGFHNDCGFQPVAPERGIPDDLSAEARQYLDWWRAKEPTTGAGTSWVTLAELQGIDWEHIGERTRARVTIHKRERDGSLAFVGTREHGVADPWIPAGDGDRRDGEEWNEGDYVLRAERVTTATSAAGTRYYWERTMAVMELLGESYPAEDVRLVAWFIH